MSLIQFNDLLACLEVSQSAEGRYTLPNMKMDYHRIFGGQLIAQAIVIAAHSAEGKAVTSLHTLLMREGDREQPVEFELESLQDGRSFASRALVGRQDDKTIFSAQISLHASEEGPAHQIAFPEVATPDESKPVELSMIPWETRAVGGVDLQSSEVGEPRYALWMRAPKLEAELPVHQALLAHSSTLNLIGTALRPQENLSEADAQMKILTAVTSHTVWFHRPLRADDWLLLHHESPTMSNARGFGTGHVFNSDRGLVASFAQENLLRPVSK